ncbi:hypothetical protein NQ318_006085 [Aromia moschata]|uniref:Uncharacterized protein n=1 Tax=Aromia moschata TaxID=1265417 RepID=A0AAV8Z234_9CUCU|nr:hypothetical protein NQ318_006085 [Aromia moschata]
MSIVSRIEAEHVLLLTACVLSASAAPAPKPKASVLAAAPLAVAPALAPAVVTAQSSQVIARNYNALAAPWWRLPPLPTSPRRTARLT